MAENNQQTPPRLNDELANSQEFDFGNGVEPEKEKGSSSMSHVGQTHNKVEKYLPAMAKIPLSVHGRGRHRRRRRMKPVVVCSLEEVFPAVPEGWIPCTREIEDEVLIV